MKKFNLLFILFSVCLFGCDEASKNEYKTTIFGITNNFIENNDGEYTFNKLINGASVITYNNSNGEITTLNLSDFNINFDLLIAGDALKITHNSKEDILFANILPGQGHINGNISKIEVEYTNVYEVILKKNNSNISFEYVDSSIEYEISLPRFRTGYCVSKDNNEIIKREFETYEDGTKLYYTYNPIFSNPLEYTCLFDYNPRQ